MNKRTKKKKRTISTLTPIIIGLSFVVLISIAISIYFNQEEKIDQLNKIHGELDKEKEEALGQQEEMEHLLEDWDSQEYIERIAREKFGLVKPGEILFVE